MPADPQPAKNDTVETFTAGLDDGHTVYILAIYPITDSARARPDDALKSIHAELVGSGKVLEDKAIMLGKYHGREIRMTIKNDGVDYAYNHRVYVAAERTVQMMMITGPASKATPADGKRFFDSAKLSGPENDGTAK